MLTPEKLKELRELANEVLEIGEFYADGIDICTKDGDGEDFVVINGITIPEVMDYFFATNPQTILKLLDEIEQLQAQVAVMREALENIPYNEYGESLREGLDGHGAWETFCETCGEHVRQALSTNAGREMLERMRKLEQVAEAAREASKNGYANYLTKNILLKALAELEKGDDVGGEDV